MESLIDSIGPIETVIGGGGIGVLFLLFKFFIKQGAGGVLDVKEMGARNDILEDLRTEMKALRERVNDLETKVAKLQDRLVVVRTHGLEAYGLVHNHFPKCEQTTELLELLIKIIKED